MRRIIFHCPFPVDNAIASASAIRPLRMLEAFCDAGCAVDVVAGNARERKDSINRVIGNIRRGVKYDFLYSESSTLPTLLTEPSRIPTWPSKDFGLFRVCKAAGVPIGVFYRDIYWAFPEFRSRLGSIKFKMSEFFYNYDLHRYEELVDKVYLPSIAMAEYVPIVSSSKFDDLPPGHAGNKNVDARSSEHARLHLIYVGGLGTHYQMHELFCAVQHFDSVRLTVCTREKDWDNVRSSYINPVPSNIRIVHASGNELKHIYADADVAALCVRPHAYREFAVPFKLFEYLGCHLPVVASTGTLSGKFVMDNDIGWQVPYNKDSILSLLRDIDRDRSVLSAKRRKAEALAPQHTWLARAEKVIEDMRELRGKNR